MAYSNSKLLGSITSLLLAIALPALAQVKPLNRVAVIVNDGVIMESQVAKRLKKITANIKKQNVNPPPQDVLTRKVVEQLILEEIQLQIGERVGVRIDDNTLNQTIDRIARQNGFTLEGFQKALEKDGLSYRETRLQIRREMIISRVRDGRVGARIQVTEQEAQNYMDSEAGKIQLQAEYRLGHILLSLPESASINELATVESKTNNLYEQLANGADFSVLAKEYSAGPDAEEGGDMGWRKESQLPSLFADIAPSMSAGDISRPLKAGNGFHIIKVLQKRGGNSVLTPQTHVRHILIKPSEIRTDQQAQALIVELRDRIVSGESFADIATNNSDDTSSLADGGDLDWVNPGEMADEFRAVMGESVIDVISEPFRTDFGWHILQVLERREHDVGLEIKRRRAKEFVYQRKFKEEVEIWLREERDDAYVDIKLY